MLVGRREQKVGGERKSGQMEALSAMEETGACGQCREDLAGVPPAEL